MIEPFYIFLLVALVVSVTIAMLVLPNILLISHKKKLFDMPDKRKVHHAPVPRLGGLSFFPVMLITMGGLVLIYHLMGLSSGSMHGEVPYEFLALLVGSMMLFLVGLADDLIGVGYKKKFLVQIVAASLLVASGVWIKSLDGLFGIYQLSPWVGMPFTVLIVVYVTNAINLIDGIDGLASGLCGISLVALAGRDYPFLVLQRVWKCHEGQEALYGRFGFAVAGLHHQFPDDSPEHGGCEPACGV